MKNTIKIICLALAMALTPFTGNALADGHDKTGPYVGMGFGKTKLDFDRKNANGSANIETENWAPSVFGGFMFHPNFGAEGGIVWYGDKLNDVDNDTGEVSVNTFYLSAVGKYQVADNFAAYAKAGMHRWAYEEKSDVASRNPRTSKFRLNGFDPMFGLGVQFDASEQTSFRLEWSRYMVGDKKDGAKYDGDLDIFGVQMLYRL